jgi:aconitate hydratase
MVKLYDSGVYLSEGKTILGEKEYKGNMSKEEARKGTMAYQILSAHNISEDINDLELRFDALTSHDITFVGIVQTAKASGMEKFPLPYVLTNCHNSLCAVGGTINEDDHIFGLSAARKYGGIFVPPHMAVIHQYMRETMAGGGKMILGSDSHTRYGALGTMAVGEGGGELVKQLLSTTYDMHYPEVIGIYMTGRPNPGVGPQDVALAIIRAVFDTGYVKNKVMEFVGPGIASMTTDYRNSVDVMTTETTCWSSVWQTDEDTRAFLRVHGREQDYKKMAPKSLTYYDGLVYVDLSKIKPMIALPFHPSNAFEIDELKENLADILATVEKKAQAMVSNPDIRFSLQDKIVNGQLQLQQGVIAGCAGGTYTNVMEAAHILQHKSCGNGIFSLSVYPSSQPVYMDLVKKGAVSALMASGATLRTAFCGPCFGASDTPLNNGLSIRHTTRNFPYREGSKPNNGQMSAVALMDARSIAATAANGGILTSATEIADGYEVPAYTFDSSAYDSRVYSGFGKAEKEAALIYGPNIKDWPKMSPLTDNILLKVCAKLMDAVTTTDELIPSGETSSYRSNPLGLAEFTLSRRDPGYVERTKQVAKMEAGRQEAGLFEEYPELQKVYDAIRTIPGNENVAADAVAIGSLLYAVKPGDGSAREQAASCQRVIGGLANIAQEYATKRYRSNVINWGMLPFQLKEAPAFEVGDYIYIPHIKTLLNGDMQDIKAYIIREKIEEMSLYIAKLTDKEKEIIQAGCLINFNQQGK